jgi:hypothetical protein
MKAFCGILVILGILGCFLPENQDVNKIIRAKEIVRSKLNYPDTASFHLNTEVNGDTVTLTVTAKNGFGVPSTQTFTVNVK